PAVALEPDLDPGMRLAVADVPEVLRLVEGAAGEADRDPGGNAEIAKHERHGTREVLAIAGVRPRDESHQRRRAHGWEVRVVERAGGEEPPLEPLDGVVRSPGAARHSLRETRERQ